MTTKKAKASRHSATDLKNHCILLGNSAGGHASWGYISAFENTPEKLILKSIFPLKVEEAISLSGSKKSAVGA